MQRTVAAAVLVLVAASEAPEKPQVALAAVAKLAVSGPHDYVDRSELEAARRTISSLRQDLGRHRGDAEQLRKAMKAQAAIREDIMESAEKEHSLRLLLSVQQADRKKEHKAALEAQAKLQAQVDKETLAEADAARHADTLVSSRDRLQAELTAEKAAEANATRTAADAVMKGQELKAELSEEARRQQEASSEAKTATAEERQLQAQLADEHIVEATIRTNAEKVEVALRAQLAQQKKRQEEADKASAQLRQQLEDDKKTRQEKRGAAGDAHQVMKAELAQDTTLLADLQAELANARRAMHEENGTLASTLSIREQLKQAFDEAQNSSAKLREELASQRRVYAELANNSTRDALELKKVQTELWAAAAEEKLEQGRQTEAEQAKVALETKLSEETAQAKALHKEEAQLRHTMTSQANASAKLAHNEESLRDQLVAEKKLEGTLQAQFADSEKTVSQQKITLAANAILLKQLRSQASTANQDVESLKDQVAVAQREYAQLKANMTHDAGSQTHWLWR